MALPQAVRPSHSGALGAVDTDRGLIDAYVAAQLRGQCVVVWID
ncbi:hypothetical protein OOK36_07610 [Streptomyces sp. NBC_00365]|nr:hypothetical protein [Streptomyces sp. NBC_00365]MCX5088762.1 hypothetical protein [Streptomyces sp. NBC_00365]